MRYSVFVLYISILFLSISYVSAQQTYIRKYKIYIKYNDGHVLKGGFIDAKDSSLVLFKKRDTLNVLIEEIKLIKIKKRFNHFILSGFLVTSTAIIFGSNAYNNYEPQGFISVGPWPTAIAGGFYGVLIMGAPIAGIIILIKELTKKTYYLNGSQLSYNLIRPSLQKLNIKHLRR